MISISDVKLVDLLPSNLAQDPAVAAAAQALDAELQAVTWAVKECLLLSRIDELSEPALDVLAWELHVDFYEPDLPVETKRELVKNSIPWHRRKGTPAAVEELITALFGDGLVQEWWEYGGQPYHFKVKTYNQSVTQDQTQRFMRALQAVKNLRSVLDAVEVTVIDNHHLYFAGVVYTGDHLKVWQVV